MNKDAYYFPHFSNARKDRKIMRVRKELGIEGYGIFFMILEVLRDEDNYRYPVEDIDLLADEFKTSEQKVRTVVCNYNLFEVDEQEKFFSPKFDEFMQPYLKMKAQRRQAGLKSAEKRKQKQLPFNDRSTTVQQSKVNESKVNESKVKTTKESDTTDNIIKDLIESKDYSKNYLEWIGFRAEMKLKKLTPTGIKSQLKFLDKQPDPIECIEQSIRNSYQGLFEVKNGTNKKQDITRIRKYTESDTKLAAGFKTLEGL